MQWSRSGSAAPPLVRPCPTRPGSESMVDHVENIVLQAKEFGLGRNGQQTLIATAAFVTDVHALGFAVAQGLRVPASSTGT